MTDNVYKWLCGVLATQPSQAKWDRKYSGEPYRAVLGRVADYFVVAGAKRCWARDSWRPAPHTLLRAAASVASGGVTDTTPAVVARNMQYLCTAYPSHAERLHRANHKDSDGGMLLAPYAAEVCGGWEAGIGTVAGHWDDILSRFIETLDLSQYNPSVHPPLDLSVTETLGGIA